MQSRDFLEALLPPEGHLVLGVLPQKTESTPKPKLFHKYHTSIDSVLEDAKKEQEKMRDVYIAMSRFSRSGTRTASDAVSIKSFFLDLDVGEGDLRYPTKRAAVEALAAFIKRTDLPMPTLVDSGGGVHVYWVLDEAVPVAQWFPVAVQLKRLCKEHEFLIDRTVTSDAARVMRMVGFNNIKRNSPCVVKSWRGTLPFEQFKAAIDAHLPPMAWLETAKADWMRESKLAKVEVDPNRYSLFTPIVTKSLKSENGCPQLANCVINQAVIPEPLWRAGLSVAWACEDGTEAVHKLSNKHPEYDYDSTIAKAMATKGPYRCDTFEDLNPGGCEGCKHRGKITSPIQLGAAMRTTPAVQGAYRVEPEVHEGEVQVESESRPVEIPEYPFPYFRPSSGGVAITVDGIDGEKISTVITDTDFWVHKLVRDQVTSNLTLWIKSYHKVQGTVDMLVPNCVNQKGELMKHLETKGLIFDTRADKFVQDYIHRSIRKMNNSERALVAVNQFGWSPTKDSFVLGEKRYMRDGSVDYAPPSSYTASLVPHLVQSGSFEEWRKAVSLYFTPDARWYPNLALFLSAFASPLMPFTNKNGVILSVYDSGGTGKTTAQRAALSVYGNPKILMNLKADTAKSRIERMGVLSNLPAAWEETTDTEPAELVRSSYTVAEGKSGNQANQYGGGEKISDRTWSLIVTSSSNNSLREKLLQISTHDTSANAARIVELRGIPNRTITLEEGNKLEAAVINNYGWAGPFYIGKVVQHVDKLAQRVNDTIVHASKHPKVTTKDRYAIALYAATVVAAEFVHEIGLFDIPDVSKFKQWMFDVILSGVDQLATIQVEAGDMLGEYIRTYARNCLTVDKGLQDKVIVVDAERIASPVMMRYERHEGMLFVPIKEARKFCIAQGQSFDTFVQQIHAAGMLEKPDPVMKRLLSGLFGGAAGTPMRCLQIRMLDLEHAVVSKK